MEIKKNSNVNNESLRGPIVLMALLFVGGLVLASFSYQTMMERDFKALASESAKDIEFSVEEKAPEEEPIIQPERKVILPPPPPPPPPLPPPAPPTDFPDVEAMFPGGAGELQKWINSNVVYPEVSIGVGDQGRVYLTFIVEADGSLTGITIAKNLTKELDREAKRVARKMPKWIPGEVAGKRVRTRCSLPIVFRLE